MQGVCPKTRLRELPDCIFLSSGFAGRVLCFTGVLREYTFSPFLMVYWEYGKEFCQTTAACHLVPADPLREPFKRMLSMTFQRVVPHGRRRRASCFRMRVLQIVHSTQWACHSRHIKLCSLKNKFENFLSLSPVGFYPVFPSLAPLNFIIP